MRRCVLVTGASSGIGLEISRLFLARGERVLLLSNLENELTQAVEPFSAELAVPVLCDLSIPAQVQGLWGRLEAEHGPISVLVNNAGIGHHGEILDTEMEIYRRLLEVNFLAAVDLCRQALTAMKSRGRGHILNLTSASARRPLARMSAYGSSKAALHAYTQTLRMEAARYGVRVSEVLPISVATPFFQRASNTSGRQYQPRGLQHTPQEVARMVLRCLDQDIAEMVTHRPTALGMALDALFPNLVARLLGWWEARSRR
jgi:short-subunit dehydrogenase